MSEIVLFCRGGCIGVYFVVGAIVLDVVIERLYRCVFAVIW